MSRLLSRMILALSALVIAAPADFCLLKVAGICCKTQCGNDSCCDSGCCHHKQAPVKNAGCGCDGQQHNTCCAFTLSDGIHTDSQLPSSDVPANLPPPSSFELCAAIFDSMHSAAIAPASAFRERATDTPLFLRVRTFLI